MKKSKRKNEMGKKAVAGKLMLCCWKGKSIKLFKVYKEYIQNGTV